MKKYYSQVGQDEFLDIEIFKKKSNGFFVEIGANDGVLFSNTLFFEKYRSWSGLLIEPNPDQFEKILKNRKSKSLNISISDIEGEMVFNKVSGYGQQLSGLVLKYDPKHVERINKTIEEFGGFQEQIKISSDSLANVFENQGVKKIDFVSLDTEGGELDILKTIDFSKVIIEVFIVENNYSDNGIYEFLTSKGYKLIKRLEMDEIYLRRNLILNFLAKIKRKLI